MAGFGGSPGLSLLGSIHSARENQKIKQQEAMRQQVQDRLDQLRIRQAEQNYTDSVWQQQNREREAEAAQAAAARSAEQDSAARAEFVNQWLAQNPNRTQSEAIMAWNARQSDSRVDLEGEAIDREGDLLGNIRSRQTIEATAEDREREGQEREQEGLVEQYAAAIMSDPDAVSMLTGAVGDADALGQARIRITGMLRDQGLSPTMAQNAYKEAERQVLTQGNIGLRPERPTGRSGPVSIPADERRVIGAAGENIFDSRVEEAIAGNINVPPGADEQEVARVRENARRMGIRQVEAEMGETIEDLKAVQTLLEAGDPGFVEDLETIMPEALPMLTGDPGRDASILRSLILSLEERRLEYLQSLRNDNTREVRPAGGSAAQTRQQSLAEALGGGNE